jgi:maltose-binding protein MalE
MFDKKIWSLISLFLITAMLLAACGPSATPTEEPMATEEAMATEEPKAEVTEEPAPSLTGTITLWHSLKEGEIEGMAAAIESFQEQYTSVNFDVLFVPFDDLRGKFETAAATGGGPTLLIGAADWGPALFDAELVADVAPLAELSFLQGINQAALGSVRYKDALVGLPLGLKGVVLYRNSSIIAEAPATAEDMIAAAQAATTNDIVGADLERGFFFSAGHLYGVGGQLMGEPGNPLFNDSRGVDWLNLLSSFSDAGPTEYYTDNDVNLFKQNAAGFIIDGTWNLNDMAAAIGEENLSIDPWPAPMSGFVQNDNIYMGINAEGDDKAATWAFMENLLAPETQAVLAENNTGFIPAALGVDVPDRLRQEAVAAFEGGVSFPVIPEMGAYWGPMDTALKSVFDEGDDPEFALGLADNSVNAAVAEIRGEQAPEPEVLGTVTLWHSLKEGEIEGMSAVIAAFQEKNPGVEFDMLFVPFDDLRGKFETAAATGGGPSLLIGAADWGPALFDAELVLDISSYASTVFLSTFNQAALGSVEYKNALVGLPLGLKGVVLYRNSSIIADAPATAEDMIATSLEATAGDVVGADLERGFFFSAGHLMGVGGQLMASDGDPLFNDEKGVEWLNLLSSFSDAGPTEYYTDNDVNLFKQNAAGMIIDGTWNLNDLAATIGEENLSIDPWPTSMSGFVQTDNVYVGTNVEGDDLSATITFGRYLFSLEAQSLLTSENTGYIPPIAGVEVPDRLRQEAVAAFEGGVAFPVIPEMGAYWGPMDTALKSVLDEGADPAAALQQAFDSIVAAIEEIRGGN